ncbi:unnamed protein product, partial [Ectocarpus sp. 8 AP-2014]
MPAFVCYRIKHLYSSPPRGFTGNKVYSPPAVPQPPRSLPRCHGFKRGVKAKQENACLLICYKWIKHHYGSSRSACGTHGQQSCSLSEPPPPPLRTLPRCSRVQITRQGSQNHACLVAKWIKIITSRPPGGLTINKDNSL